MEGREMKLPSRIVFADIKIKQAFEKLNLGTKGEQQLHKTLVKTFEKLEKNAFAGIQIPKRQIPEDYVGKYGIDNCWKYNLPNAWRILYHIQAGNVYVDAIVLDWMDHKDYEKKLKYAVK